MRETGKTAEGAVCYTISQVHTIEKFVAKARQLEDSGVHQICIIKIWRASLIRIPRTSWFPL